MPSRRRADRLFECATAASRSARLCNECVGWSFAWTGRNLWHFICGRGCHEKVLAELKNGYAFNCVPTMKYAANGAWQISSVLAFNLMRGMQAATTASQRCPGRSRRCGYVFETIHTLRYTWLRRTGLVVGPQGRSVLDVADNVVVRHRFEQIADRLAEAA